MYIYLAAFFYLNIRPNSCFKYMIFMLSIDFRNVIIDVHAFNSYCPACHVISLELGGKYFIFMSVVIIANLC